MASSLKINSRFISGSKAQLSNLLKRALCVHWNKFMWPADCLPGEAGMQDFWKHKVCFQTNFFQSSELGRQWHQHQKGHRWRVKSTRLQHWQYLPGTHLVCKSWGLPAFSPRSGENTSLSRKEASDKETLSFHLLLELLVGFRKHHRLS